MSRTGPWFLSSAAAAGDNTCAEDITSYCALQDEPIGQLTLSDVFYTFCLNVLVFLLLLCLFEKQRANRSIYFCRSIWMPHRCPPELPRGILRWVVPLMTMKADRVHSLVGLDGYMLLRYIKLCKRVCLFSGVLGTIILIPLYIYGDETQRQEHWDAAFVLQHPSVLSISNLKKQSLFWVPILMAYIMTAHVMYLLVNEYKKFLGYRLKYLAFGDRDMDPQKNFSVIVDRIPPEYQSNVALFSLFSEMFPSQVHSAVVALRIPRLESLVQRREQVLDKLERALAKRDRTGKEPTHHVAKPGRTCWEGMTCRSVRVESVAYLQAQLESLNARITSEQTAIKRASDAVETEVEQKQQREKERSGRSWASAQRVVTELLTGRRTGLLEPEEPLYYEKRLARMEDVRMACRKVSCPQDEDPGAEQVDFDAALSDQADRQRGQQVSSINRLAGPDGPAENEKIVGRDSDGEETSIVGLVRTVAELPLRAIGVTGSVALQGAQQVTKAVGLLTLGSSMSSTGFVTFKSLTAATTAAQTLLTAQSSVFTCSPAPEPRDVVWHNIGVPLSQVELRQYYMSWLFLVLAIPWAATQVLIYKLQSYLQTLSLEGLDPYLQLLISLGLDYFPTVLLLIILALIPLVFWAASERYERQRTYSDIQASIMGRYLYYQLVNIYVTLIGGGVFDELRLLIRCPRMILEVLGCQVPAVGVYFMQFIVTKTFSGLMWEFSRAWPLLRMWWMDMLRDPRRLTARQRRSGVFGPPEFGYGWTYPSLLLVFTICLTYVVIMPVTLLLGAIFFFAAEVLHRYHLMYVYVPQYESGGRHFFVVFDRTILALFLSHITLIGFVAIIGGGVSPFLTPLPITLGIFYRYCHTQYREASLKLSLLAARRIDDQLQSEAVQDASPPTETPTGGEGGAVSPPGADVEQAEGGGGTAAGVSGRSLGAQRIEEAEKRRAEGPVAASVVDYFGISAYAQPSLTEAPQQPEPTASYVEDTSFAHESHKSRHRRRWCSCSRQQDDDEELSEPLKPAEED